MSIQRLRPQKKSKGRFPPEVFRRGDVWAFVVFGTSIGSFLGCVDKVIRIDRENYLVQFLWTQNHRKEGFVYFKNDHEARQSQTTTNIRWATRFVGRMLDFPVPVKFITRIRQLPPETFGTYLLEDSTRIPRSFDSYWYYEETLLWRMVSDFIKHKRRDLDALSTLHRIDFERLSEKAKAAGLFANDIYWSGSKAKKARFYQWLSQNINRMLVSESTLVRLEREDRAREMQLYYTYLDQLDEEISK
jgi:hypothetical protein